MSVLYKYVYKMLVTFAYTWEWTLVLESFYIVVSSLVWSLYIIVIMLQGLIILRKIKCCNALVFHAKKKECIFLLIVFINLNKNCFCLL